ncbi:MAG: hypothetical protein LUD19_06280 [Clostridia bacterium]|nr:hypothetical protein [Clostridia bacterium]
MKNIYILLTKSNTVVSRLIHKFTADEYTHVSICFDDRFYTLFSSARKNDKTLFPAGPCREDIRCGRLKDYPETPCAALKLQVSDVVYKRIVAETMRIMDREYNYHYNILGLFLCMLKIPYHRKHHLFCAEFVGKVLTKSRALELPKDYSIMKPADYIKIPELVCMYRGNIGGLIRQF